MQIQEEEEGRQKYREKERETNAYKKSGDANTGRRRETKLHKEGKRDKYKLG